MDTRPPDVERLMFQLAIKAGLKEVPKEMLEDELVDKLVILADIIEAFQAAGFTLTRNPTPSG